MTSEMDQADAGAPALSEKVNGAEGWQPDVCCCISSDAIYEVRRLLNAQNVPAAAFIDDHVGNAIAQRNILAGCLSRMRELIDAALTEAKAGGRSCSRSRLSWQQLTTELKHSNRRFSRIS